MKYSVIILALLAFSLFITLSYSHGMGEGLVVEYDEDEFEGMEKVVEQKYENLAEEVNEKEPTTTTTTTTTTQEPEQEYKQPRWKTQQHWYMEIFFIVFIVCYAINYYMGRKTNQGIVALWGQKNRNIFSSNFSYLGPQGVYVISKVDSNTYTFNASGRINCYGAQVTLDLKKRHDLFTTLLDQIGYADPDRITIEVAMKEDEMDPIIFAVTKNKAFKKFKSDNQDLQLFAAKIANPNSLSAGYAVMGDTDGLPSLLLKSDIIATLNANESLFESLHFTDHSTINPKYQHTLSFVFKLPKIKEIEKSQDLLKMAIDYIDLVANTQLPKAQKAKAEKLREKEREAVHKQLQQERVEKAQQAKIEKEKKEKEAIGKLTPEEQRKYDEKEYKKQLKRRSKQSRIVVG